ncbi:hypothetical protein ACFSJW_06725 [Flavobacterium artemisiae]|uniref:Copper chaperone NosL n=1 Tax=Flavobacterium artemisiae TaxID=2126556 RepID=A0ABW4HCL8_9FLAO
MKKITAILSLVLITQFCVSCEKTLSDEQIKQYMWKCGQPCGLGDLIVFNQNVILKNDTIFLNQQPYAKIVDKTNGFDEDTKIAVINLQNPVIKDTCIFHAK